MNINELNSFKISDAVQLHDRLNPALFEYDHLKSEVREKLLEIAREFINELGVKDLHVKDITLSGSNAAYSYTPHSDIDLHIVTDMKELPNDEIYQELFTAKKNQFNDKHDIKIKDYDVELYVQDSNKPVRTLGEYSVLHDEWNKMPSKRRSNYNETAVEHKFKKLVQLTHLAVASGDIDAVNDVIGTLRRYRQAGLDEHGEFGPENLAYKAMRTHGLIDKLYDHRDHLKSRELSLDEMMDESFDQPYKTKWKKSNFAHPGSAYSEVQLPDGTPLIVVFYNQGDGKYSVEFSRNRSGGLTGRGDAQRIFATVLHDILKFAEERKPRRLAFTASKELDPNPEPGVRANPNSRAKLYTRMVKRYAEPLGYSVQYQEVPGQVSYTLNRLNQDADDDVSLDEERQNLVWLRGKLSGSYTDQQLKDMGARLVNGQWAMPREVFNRLINSGQLREASGYIPSEDQKDDPRFKTALSVDVHPDSIQQNAKKLGSKIKRNGVPPTLKASGKI